MTTPTTVKKAGSVFLVAMRVARLASTGAPLVGAKNLITSDNIGKLDFSLEMRDGVEVERLNANNRACMYYSAPATVKRLVVDSLELCLPEPELFDMLGGWDTIADTNSRIIGAAAPEVGSDPSGDGVSLELWSSAVGDDGIDTDLPYVHWLLPRLSLRQDGSISLGPDPVAATFKGTGAQNPNWGDGPKGDWDHISERVVQWVRTASLPTLVDGYQAIS